MKIFPKTHHAIARAILLSTLFGATPLWAETTDPSQEASQATSQEEATTQAEASAAESETASAATNDKTENNAQPPSLLRQKKLAAQLKRQPSNAELHWFNDAFLGLYRPHHAAQERGQIVILHDNQQHPDWPGLIRQIGKQLPAVGWNTISIGLPDYQETSSPQEQADIAKAASNRTQAALEYLQAKSDAPIIVIAIGTAATWILNADNNGDRWGGKVAGLVIVDPVILNDFPELDSANALAKLPLPVLDIAPAIYPRSDQQLRKQKVRQAVKSDYRAITLPGSRQGFYGFEPHVINAVRGWAKRNQIQR